MKPWRIRLCAAPALATVVALLPACTLTQPTAPASNVAPAPADQARYISVEELNALALSLPRPPQDSSTFDYDVTHLFEKYATAWPMAVTRAKATAPKDDYSKWGFDYLVLIDPDLAAKVDAATTPQARVDACRARCPETCALLERATRDLVTSKYKPFERRRPIGERNDSYPSGHAAQAVLQCRLLWEVVRTSRPGAEDTLLREAYARAIDRVVIAIHHPTDVIAGLAFGLAAADRIIKDDSPAFHRALDAARREW